MSKTGTLIETKPVQKTKAVLLFLSIALFVAFVRLPVADNTERVDVPSSFKLHPSLCHFSHLILSGLNQQDCAAA